MMHWLHHILFDSLSAWEKFQLDMLGAFIILLLGLAYIGIISSIRKKGE